MLTGELWRCWQAFLYEQSQISLNVGLYATLTADNPIGKIINRWKGLNFMLQLSDCLGCIFYFTCHNLILMHFLSQVQNHLIKVRKASWLTCFGHLGHGWSWSKFHEIQQFLVTTQTIYIHIYIYIQNIQWWDWQPCCLTITPAPPFPPFTLSTSCHDRCLKSLQCEHDVPRLVQMPTLDATVVCRNINR